MGQWFKGRIYERRSDLSPDGKYLIYFAAKYVSKGEALYSWTAISFAPFIKALALYAKGDTYYGGGLWTTNRSYWLNPGPGYNSALFDTGLVSEDMSYQPPRIGNAECLGVYYPRLLRDGWKLLHSLRSDKAKTDIFEKDLSHAWRLRKFALAGSIKVPGRGVYRDEHELVHSKTGTVIKFPKWEWAERDGQDVVWAEGGKLMRAVVGEGGLQSTRLIRDFNDMTFEPIEAPY